MKPLAHIDFRTTEIRPFEHECWDPETIGHLMDGFQRAFHKELEEIAAFKEWAAQQSQETGAPVEAILMAGMNEFGSIVRKSNFLSERRKAIETETARKRGIEPTLLTKPLPEDKEQRIFEEPGYMALLNDDLSDPANYFGRKQKQQARFNREILDESVRRVREAEDQSVALRRRR